MTNHKILLLGNWTNPETKTAHKRGDVVSVPEYMLRSEGRFGLQGIYKVATPEVLEHKAEYLGEKTSAPATTTPKSTTTTTSNKE